MPIALVDADIVCYRTAASCEPNKSGRDVREPLEDAIKRCDELMKRILHETGTTEYKAFISGPENFRYSIDPEYKSNRANQPRPLWLEPVREHLVVQWGGYVSDGVETDDHLGIEQTGDTIICSIDKDLLQIPGRHYNFVTGVFTDIDEAQGWRNFYTQLILGDKSDNIPGYDGKMRPKVPNFLQQHIDWLNEQTSPIDMFQTVLPLYEDHLGYERMIQNCHLLYILRHKEDSYQVPH